MRATFIGFKIVRILSLFQFVFFFPDPEFMARRGSKGANESDVTSPDVGQKLCFDDETLKGKVTATKTITKIFVSAFNMSKADIFSWLQFCKTLVFLWLFGDVCAQDTKIFFCWRVYRMKNNC